MAPLHTGGHKALTALQSDVAEKENQPPPKSTKRTASIAGLFDNGKRLRHKANEHSSDESRAKAAGNKTSSDAFFASFSAPKKAAPNPLYLNFKDAADAYNEGVGASTSQQLQPVRESLLARINGLDISGNPVKTPGVPTLAEMEALDKEHEALSAPLSEEIIPIQVQQADGSVVTKRVKLEKTLQAFERRFALKQAEIQKLTGELDRVVAEIEIAEQDCMADEDGALEKAKEKRRAKKAAIRQRGEVLKQQTLDEIEQAQKDEKAATAETNRRFQEFMMALQ